MRFRRAGAIGTGSFAWNEKILDAQLGAGSTAGTWYTKGMGDYSNGATRMAEECSHSDRRDRTLDVLEKIAQAHAVRSRARSALVCGAVAMDIIERYVSRLKMEAAREGQSRGRLENKLFREVEKRWSIDHRSKKQARRLALARQKIWGNLSALADIGKGYAIGSEEMEALATAAFALVRVALEDRPLLVYCRARADMGKPLTSRQRKHLQSLGISI